MPNHVKNIVKVSGKAEPFFEATTEVLAEEVDFDFNKIIPQPELIKLPEGVDGIASHIVDAAELVMMHCNWPVLDYNGKKQRIPMNYGHQRKWEDTDFLYFKRCCEAIMDCGYSHWHPWNVVHWGTKWGAYRCERVGNTLKFETAWSTPMGIWKKINEMFPETNLLIHYSDEDYGSNCGIITIDKNGLDHKTVNTNEFAYETWGLDKAVIAEMEAEQES